VRTRVNPAALIRRTRETDVDGCIYSQHRINISLGNLAAGTRRHIFKTGSFECAPEQVLADEHHAEPVAERPAQIDVGNLQGVGHAEKD